MSNKRKGADIATQPHKGTVVPRLRFPEFKDAGEWETRRLGELSTPIATKVGNEKLIPLSISAGTGFVRQSEKFGRDISGMQSSSYTVVADGDFVYNKGNSLRFPQGCIYQLQGWVRAAVPFVFICFRINAGEIQKFYGYCFEYNMHGKQLARHITSSVRNNGLLNINKDDFYSIAIPHPCFREQQKIADCLSTLDDAISAVSRKLEAMKTHKKGLMQQLFPRAGETTPRLCFPEFRNAGEWKETKLIDVLNPVSREVPKPDYNYTGLGLRSHGKGTFQKPDQVPEKNSMDRLYLVNRDDLVLNITFAWEGAIAIASNSDHGCYVSHRFPTYLFRSSRTTSQFFKYIIIGKTFVQKLGLISPGGAGRNKVMNKNDFLKLSVLLPTLPEQQKIADCLSILDEAISAVSRKLEALKTHKKGLMQSLFPDMMEVNG